MACPRCQKVVGDDERIICRGYCGCSFHAFCAHIDRPVQEMLTSHPRNLFWMCDGCADLFSNDHLRRLINLNTIDNEPNEISVRALMDDIIKLSDAVSTLSAKVDAKLLTPTTNPAWKKVNRPTAMNTPKRKRVEESTPLPITRGTKPVSALVKTVQQSKAENLFWIYLSAFHPSTSESDIEALTKECLSMDMDAKPRIIKLIPKDKDIASLSFVSFKVGISMTLKDIALSTDSWPENVSFREFTNFGKKTNDE